MHPARTMLMHILLGTDGSSHAIAAAARALELLAPADTLTLLAVAPTPAIAFQGFESGFAGGMASTQEVEAALKGRSTRGAGRDRSGARARATTGLDSPAGRDGRTGSSALPPGARFEGGRRRRRIARPRRGKASTARFGQHLRDAPRGLPRAGSSEQNLSHERPQLDLYFFGSLEANRIGDRLSHQERPRVGVGGGGVYEW